MSPAASTPRAGLRVVITAGAAGIGRAIAEAFHGAGSRVHICDVSREAIAECEDALPGIGAALFLCSPAGRISGQALSVCGNVETL